MKTTVTRAVLVAALLAITSIARAQYYEAANQLTNLISPALSGSGNYKGFVEVSGLAGVGDNRANFLGVSTTQGYKYNNWFFMGAGMGIDVAMTPGDDPRASQTPSDAPGWYGHSYARTKAILPVFSDFRFNFGATDGISMFADLKLGAAWLLGSDYLALQNGVLTTATQFYLRPSLGIRVPIEKAHPNRAVNLALTYQLLTSNNNYGWYNNGVTLSNIGLTIAYEW